MAKTTYLNQDSYFIDDKGEFYFFEKGTSSDFYSHLKRLTKDSPEMIEKEFQERFKQDKERLKKAQYLQLAAHYTFKSKPIQADSDSLNALIAAKESGNDPIKWYDAHNEAVLLSLAEIQELIAKISIRNGKIIKENQAAKDELNKCENMQQLKEWEVKNGIN